DGTHARDDGIGYRHARGRQSPCRCIAGAVSDGRRCDRRAVRGARWTEDERRAAPSPPWPAGACGRNPLRPRSRAAAADVLSHSSPGRRHMPRPPPFGLLAALGALMVSVAPAAGERLVASLSNHRVMVTSNFTGEELVLFGGIEQDATSRPRR